MKKFLAKILAALRGKEIVSLKAQLKAKHADVVRLTDNYCILVDEHCDLRQAYGKLQFARLEDFRLNRPVNGFGKEEHAGGDEHPVKAKGLAGHRRRSAPTAGDR